MSYDSMGPPRAFWRFYQPTDSELLEIELQYDHHEDVAARLDDGDELPELDERDRKLIEQHLRDRNLVLYHNVTDRFLTVATPEQAAEWALLDEEAEASRALKGAA